MNSIQDPETPKERQNHLARESYARQRLLLTTEQLDYQYAQQHNIYRSHTEAESNEQAEYQRKSRCTAYINSNNAAHIHIYNTNSVLQHSGDALAPVFSICCANGKVNLSAINQPPELLLSLLAGEDSRSHKQLTYRQSIMPELDLTILEQLQEMLHAVNLNVHIFNKLHIF
ncbi:4925_t:CDS:2 [Racocetra fulgida]|uniref:4925_t:CDS:1 n=1 Tax=Racocetra fulgida TaxID=60492 RepID=A0A9N9GGI7_9GLOM|nr:4925_t:CDS:2 [Racocetra fulgida]